jgi:hypothetical protein
MERRADRLREEMRQGFTDMRQDMRQASSSTPGAGAGCAVDERLASGSEPSELRQDVAIAAGRGHLQQDVPIAQDVAHLQQDVWNWPGLAR